MTTDDEETFLREIRRADDAAGNPVRFNPLSFPARKLVPHLLAEENSFDLLLNI